MSSHVVDRQWTSYTSTRCEGDAVHPPEPRLGCGVGGCGEGRGAAISKSQGRSDAAVYPFLPARTASLHAESTVVLYHQITVASLANAHHVWVGHSRGGVPPGKNYNLRQRRPKGLGQAGSQRHSRDPYTPSTSIKDFTSPCTRRSSLSLDSCPPAGVSNARDCISSGMESHPDPIPASESTPHALQCRICHRTFGRVGHLKRHERTAHSSSRPYACPKCSRTFSRRCVAWPTLPPPRFLLTLLVTP